MGGAPWWDGAHAHVESREPIRLRGRGPRTRGAGTHVLVGQKAGGHTQNDQQALV